MMHRPKFPGGVRGHSLRLVVLAAAYGFAAAGINAAAAPPDVNANTNATDMVTIMTLLSNHQQIRFTIGWIPNGARTITTSTDPEVVKAIQVHAHAMKTRLELGNNIRPKDPLFVEIFKHHTEIRDVITELPNGVSEDETSRNPQVVLLIRAHAKAVAGFVRDGVAATRHNTNPPKGYRSEESGVRAGSH